MKLCKCGSTEFDDVLEGAPYGSTLVYMQVGAVCADCGADECCAVDATMCTACCDLAETESVFQADGSTTELCADCAQALGVRRCADCGDWMLPEAIDAGGVCNFCKEEAAVR